MTKRLEFYKCETCGNLVQVILPGEGELVCCGEPMQLIKPLKNENEISEKHIPVFSARDDKGDEIKVGTSLHPMSKEHYIQFIEVISEGERHLELQYFTPEDLPIMELADKLGQKVARAYCNLHGLWEGEHD